MNMADCVCVCQCLCMNTWASFHPDKTTRPSAEEWICVHIKLPGTADGGEVFTVWSQVFLHPRERRTKKKEKK